MANNKHKVEQAEQAYNNQLYGEALQMFLSLIKTDREPKIVLWLGKTYFKTNDLYQARKCFEEVLWRSKDTVIQQEAGELLKETDQIYADVIETSKPKPTESDLAPIMKTSKLNLKCWIIKNINIFKNKTRVLKNKSLPTRKQIYKETNEKKTGNNLIYKAPQSFKSSIFSKNESQTLSLLSSQKLNLKAKVTTLAIALGILPVLLTGAIAYYFANQSISLQIQSEKQAKALALTDKINRFLLERYGNIQTLANLSVFSDTQVSKLYTLAQKQDLLNSFTQNYGVYDNIAVFTTAGKLIVQTSGKKLDNYSDRPYFKEALARNGPVISEPNISRSSGDLVLGFAAPIRDRTTGNTLGVMTARVPVRYIENLIREIEATGDQYYVADKTDKIFIAQQRQYLNAQANFPYLTKLKSNNEIGFSNRRSETGNKVSELVVYAPFNKLEGLPQINWSVLVVTDAKLAFLPQRQLLSTLLIGTALTALSVSLLGLIVASRGTAPILTAVQAVQKLGQGDLEARVSVRGKDELAVLGNNINLMADRIQSLVEELQTKTEYAQQLSVITVNLRNSLNLIETLEQVAKDLQKALKVDRIIICEIDPNTLKGKVLVEAVADNWAQLKGISLENLELSNQGVFRDYINGRIDFIDDTTKDLHQGDYYLSKQQHLKGFAAKAMAIAPIAVHSHLFGFLIAQHCAEPHVWKAAEVELFTKLSTQVCMAMEQLMLFQRVKQETLKAELARKKEEELRQQAITAAEEQRHQKELIQFQLIDLQNDVFAAARGDLTVYSKVSDSTSEIGTVANFFNSIIESLREIVIQVKSAASQVNNSIVKDDEAIRSLANSAGLQAVEINSTLGSIKQMSETIQEVAENARIAAELTQSASDAAELGGAAMFETVDSIFMLRQTVSDTTRKVKRLGESAQQISNVVTLINEFSLETKLLAVNATVQAARVGEENGFTVIADEIAALATRSANATEEIEQIVHNIQRETSQVVSAMDLGTSQVVEGTKLATNTKKWLVQIVELSHQLNKLVLLISNTSVSQAETSQTITDLMQQTAQVSQETANSSQRVSQSLQKTVEVAQNLQLSVGKFKVDNI